jgi:hypothetical protein
VLPLVSIFAPRENAKFEDLYRAMNAAYKRRFLELHRGMLEITTFPNFRYVYIHIGNNFGDTTGCLSVGFEMKYIKRRGEYEICQSKKAYCVLYGRLLKLLIA